MNRGRWPALRKTQQVSENTHGVASSLPKGLAVLEAFSLGSTASRILNGLAETDYIPRDGQTGHFRLGLGRLMISGPLLADLDVRRAALPYLEGLTFDTRETSAISVRIGKEAIVAEQVANPTRSSTAPQSASATPGTKARRCVDCRPNFRP